jgi:hypothetical protein
MPASNVHAPDDALPVAAYAALLEPLLAPLLQDAAAAGLLAAGFEAGGEVTGAPDGCPADRDGAGGSAALAAAAAVNRKSARTLRMHPPIMKREYAARGAGFRLAVRVCPRRPSRRGRTFSTVRRRK